MGTKILPGSLDLISRLLETFNHVLQSVSAPQADVSYVEQLLISIMENAANIIVVSNLPRGLPPYPNVAHSHRLVHVDRAIVCLHSARWG